MQQDDYLQVIKDHLRTSYLLSEEKIEEVLPRFITIVAALITELEEVSGTENIEAINRTGHSMKGALLNLGLLQLADIAFRIEKFDPVSGSGTDVTKYIAELKFELRKIT